jgi:LCP family protein required for cell wall assembly
VKNQFMHKHSQDGSKDLAGNAIEPTHNEQNPMPGIGEEQNILPTPAKSGLLPKRKTGQLQPREPELKKANQVSNTLEETEIDPLRNRQLPRIVSAPPPMPQAPAVNPLSKQASEAAMMHQPASPNRAPYQPQPQNRGGAYPAGAYNNLNQAPPPASNYGYQGPPNGYRYNAGQLGNPNPMSNASFNNAPPGFAQQPPMSPRRRINIKRIPIWARIVIAAVAFLVVTAGSAFAYYEFTIGKSVADITGNSATHKVDGQNQVIQGASVDPLTTRTNIMLLGSDTDGKGNDPSVGQPLAQTVIVITIDPSTKYVGMLSIPRDMQVTDSTTGYANEKLDQAFEYAWIGQTNKAKAAAAAGHMEDIIQQNYGIHIDHYAWVGLQGFTQVVNDIGGVDVDVTHPMFDDDYPNDASGGAKYSYTRVNIVPGPQHLTGAEALTYVRTRHADLGGDFGRTDRQQQVLSQIKVKLTQSDDIISRMTAIINDLDGYMFTDLTLNQLSQFATVAKQVDINKVDHVSFTNNYSTAAGGGNTNVLPECAAINTEIQKMFGTVGTCQTQYSSTSPQTDTALARTQTTTTETSSAPNQTTSTPREASMAAVSQSMLGSTSNFNNLLNLMLLTASGSFNAMQG